MLFWRWACCASEPIHCACRCTGFDPVQLCHLSQLQRLFLENMAITDFDVPCSWSRLKILSLEQNRLTQLPGNLSQLSALTSLCVEDQEGGMQITSPMCFLTQLKNLRELQLGQMYGSWSPSSEFALMQARLLIDSSPGCCVQFND